MSRKTSDAFLAFNREAPDHAGAWSLMVGSLAEATVLDEKTTALVYIGILAALGIQSGIPYHVQRAKAAGATRQEVIHAALIALAPAGHRVTQALPSIIEAFDGE